MTCRYCDKPIERGQETPTFSYWSKVEYVCHRECKVAGERQGAIDCQTLDADCNDCRHYKRGKLAPKTCDTIKRRDGTFFEVSFQSDSFVGGHCLKFDKVVTAVPNHSTGLTCFEHRRKT